MDRKRFKIHPLLWLALLATTVAVIFAPDEQQAPDAIVQPARRPPTQAVALGLQTAVPAGSQAGTGAPQTAEPMESSYSRADDEGRIVDIFALPKKRVPREAAVAAVPEAPVAPPFDYQYMGQVIDQGDESFFFTRAGRPYIVKAGDTLDGVFLLESISRNSAVVVYIPLKMKQTVVLGEGK